MFHCCCCFTMSVFVFVCFFWGVVFGRRQTRHLIVKRQGKGHRCQSYLVNQETKRSDRCSVLVKPMYQFCVETSGCHNPTDPVPDSRTENSTGPLSPHRRGVNLWWPTKHKVGILVDEWSQSVEVKYYQFMIVFLLFWCFIRLGYLSFLHLQFPWTLCWFTQFHTE